MSEITGQCAFCFHITDYGPDGDGVRLTVERVDDDPALQELFAHVFCLAGRLHGRIPFDPEIFGEDWAAVDGMKARTIYVPLLDEGVEVWVPVKARPQGGEGFRLPSIAPEDEKWKYAPGSIVRCRLRDLGDGPVMVAVDETAPPF